MTRPRGSGQVFSPTFKDKQGALREATTFAIGYYDRRIQRQVRRYGFTSREEAERALAGMLPSIKLEPSHPEIGGDEGRVLRWRTFGALEMAEAAGPIVYAWVRRDVVLYIGKSCDGLSRPFNGGHKGMAGKIRPSDRLLVCPCVSPAQALKVETALIRSIRPPVNIR